MPRTLISRASSAVTTTGADIRPQGLTNARAAGLLAALAVLVVGMASHDAVAQSRTIRIEDPAADQRQLDDATARLVRDPNDLQAMRDGADAAMRLGEYDVALGFLNRAEVVRPGDAFTRAMRGSVMVQLGQPRMALPMFAEAERMGARPADLAADRGLAHDLLGDQPSAQYYYAIANRIGPEPEVTRRHAFSLAVGGERQAAERMLQPLLQANDPAAWRIKAFMLAVSGRSGEAVAMLYAVLPRQLADNLAPYMRSIPRLSAGQQVAAAHLGIFPADNNVMAGNDRLVPSGRPFGAEGGSDDEPDDE